MSVVNEGSDLSSSKPANRSNWPIASLRLRVMTESIASSWIIARARRECPSESKAPALMRDSMVRLLHTTAGTFIRKSENDS